MRRGPQPKNPADRQRRNKDTLALVVDNKPAIKPPPPTGMLKASVAEWDAFWASDLARAVERQDIPVLERLFLMRDEWARYSKAVRKEPLVEGSQGQPVINPLAKRMNDLQSEIRQLEDRFGLNPAGRAKLNVTFGDAQRSIQDLVRSAYDDDDGHTLVAADDSDHHAASR